MITFRFLSSFTPYTWITFLPYILLYIRIYIYFVAFHYKSLICCQELNHLSEYLFLNSFLLFVNLLPSILKSVPFFTYFVTYALQFTSDLPVHIFYLLLYQVWIWWLTINYIKRHSEIFYLHFIFKVGGTVSIHPTIMWWIPALSQALFWEQVI